LLIFALFLALILLAAAAALLLRNERFPEPFRGAEQAAPTGDEFPPASIERAPTGDGTTLLLSSQPNTEPLSYQEIYQKNIPAIVFLSATCSDGIQQGTGIVMSQDGYVLTNAHVIEDCYRVEAYLEDGSEYQALLVGRDSDSDLAVLKLDAQGLTPAEFGDSGALEVGDKAIAIGNPLGEELRGTMTDGIISAINRDVELDNRTMVLIQTTAALNSGNSGGALINEWGQVVGITTLKMSSWYESIEGLGFAIPTATAKPIVDQLIASGAVAGRPTLGITVRMLTQETAAEYGAGTPVGLRLEEVNEKSDAWAQGLRSGDVVVEADDIPVATISELNSVKNSHSVGEYMRLRVWREGDYLDFTVRLIEQSELAS
jgi:serine protease Do